ncbi:reverse transcriptase domain-containing protein [Artemisia annua]|uniref:Reverse transcriptase domain-containing protein n=1 Tax=Artemisia annua TaxID=35608 RepID=A0A2U1QBY8_ARTAN|nr:reverse transcriptase domain-containing protein [Artemisia annua]
MLNDHSSEVCPNVRFLPRQQDYKRNNDRRRAPLTERPAGAQRPTTVPRPPGRSFHITTKEAKESHDVVSGAFFVNLIHALVFFNSGANRLFVYESFSQSFITPISQLKPPLVVEIAYSKIMHVTNVFENCEPETSEIGNGLNIII